MAKISGRAMSKAAISTDADVANLVDLTDLAEPIEDFEFDPQESERSEPAHGDEVDRFVDGLPSPVIRFNISPDMAATGGIRVIGTARTDRAFDFQVPSGGAAKEGWTIKGKGRVALGRLVISASTKKIMRSVRILPVGEAWVEGYVVD